MRIAAAAAGRENAKPGPVSAKPIVRGLVTLILLAGAAVVGGKLWFYYLEAPWTRDGRVRADVVQVATDVSGLVDEVAVHDNQAVQKGQLLFRIDQSRFQLALRDAQASVVNTLAAAQEADREMNRYLALNNLSVSTEEQQRRQTVAAEAGAAYDRALVARDTAALNLQRASVYASVNGFVTNFGLKPGNFIDAGRPVFALIDRDSFYVDGYFEETKLPRIAVGDAAKVHLMGENIDLQGTVESISNGIADREVAGSPDLLANVNPTFNWVRLAQRIPVRIKLEDVPQSLRLVTGRTATVQIMGSPSALPAQH